MNSTYSPILREIQPMPIFYLVLCALIAFYAQKQSKSFLLWFLVSVVFTPVVGLAAIIIISNKKK